MLYKASHFFVNIEVTITLGLTNYTCYYSMFSQGFFLRELGN